MPRNLSRPSSCFEGDRGALGPTSQPGRTVRGECGEALGLPIAYPRIPLIEGSLGSERAPLTALDTERDETVATADVREYGGAPSRGSGVLSWLLTPPGQPPCLLRSWANL